MNNEEKILEILQQLQQGQTAMQGDIAGLKSDVSGLKEGQAVMQGDIAKLQDDVERVRASQLKVELEQYPRISAALDGVLAGIQKNEAQDERIAYVEKKVDFHDTRLYSLEAKISKAQ